MQKQEMYSEDVTNNLYTNYSIFTFFLGTDSHNLTSQSLTTFICLLFAQNLGENHLPIGSRKEKR